jgi:hypothetical protein
MYVHGSPVMDATLRWLAKQNDDTWAELIDAWGGEQVAGLLMRALLDSLPHYGPSGNDTKGGA